MGCWSVYCGISKIAITAGQKCAIIPIKSDTNSETREWVPATLPIFGEYNDYGGLENIEENDNTKLIEKHFGISIDEFCTFLVDGKFTYEREEAEEVAEQMKNKKEAESWRFMWVDSKVYEFITKNYNNHEKGYLDYGTAEMLQQLGFKLKEKSDSFKNYDPKRFNQLWVKGDTEMFSDGKTLLSKEGRYVYNFGKGDETSMETYFKVPKELEYLKDKTAKEAWRLLSKRKAQSSLGYILGRSMYEFDFEPELLEALLKKSEGKEEIIKKEKTVKKVIPIYKQYLEDLDTYGDRIVELINMSHNMYFMSSRFEPHVLYITPQCGEYKLHQNLLEKFAEINKSYLLEKGYDEDEE